MARKRNDPGTPPCHKDRLFDGLAKGCNRHASQMVPIYSEFRLGHGDPLMQAVMKHWEVLAHPHPSPESAARKSPRTVDVYVNKEIHLKQQGSPLGRYGFNDVVHLDKDTIIAIPCIPDFQKLTG